MGEGRGVPKTSPALDRGNLNRYTTRPLQDSAILFPLSGWGNLRFTVQITGFPANVSNPRGGKSRDFSAGKCRDLRYFIVVPGSLTGARDILEGEIPECCARLGWPRRSPTAKVSYLWPTGTELPRKVSENQKFRERSNSGSHSSSFAIFRPAILTFYKSCPFPDFP